MKPLPELEKEFREKYYDNNSPSGFNQKDFTNLADIINNIGESFLREVYTQAYEAGRDYRRERIDTQQEINNILGGMSSSKAERIKALFSEVYSQGYDGGKGSYQALKTSQEALVAQAYEAGRNSE